MERKKSSKNFFMSSEAKRVITLGSKGIRQEPINLGTSPMMIYKMTPSITISGRNVWIFNLLKQLIKIQ